MSLTPKREKFVQAYVETGNASEAYRRAFKADKMSDAAIAVEASRLLDDPKVALKVDELKRHHAERHDVTVDDIRAMLLEDRKFAREMEMPAAAVSATMGLAKLYGHLRDKVETTSKVTVVLDGTTADL